MNCKNHAQYFPLVSSATARNWDRLLSSYTAGSKLQSRANKKLSKKFFVPKEYFCNINNITLIESIIAHVRENAYAIEDVLYTIATRQLTLKNIIEKSHVKTVLKDYKYNIRQDLLGFDLPEDEIDLLGIVYQSLLNEGEKNIEGAYYTSREITHNMVGSLDFSNGQTFFDPCCGSGAFILALKNVEPSQIYGTDINPIAVFITKINMLLKFSDKEFIPQIICCNYLSTCDNKRVCDYLTKHYDYIITNPPWGAKVVADYKSEHIASKESFSLFYEKSFKQLRDGGKIRFLLPESVLNVKTHRDLRAFMLRNGCLEKISYYNNTFTGVVTKVVDIQQSNKKGEESIVVVKNNKIYNLRKKSFLQTQNFVFNMLSDEDLEVVEKVKSLGVYNLSDSLWALGVVTGDNKKKLIARKVAGAEPIFTGKEIMQYKLKPAKFFIHYDRKQLQQVAKEELYRAPEKLVYKFISNKLIFSYDNKGALFLNSANILIPSIPGMSVKTVLAFLNSMLYQYLYKALFGEIKVLKGNLVELPFPQVTDLQNEKLTNLVDANLKGKDNQGEIDNEIFKIFNLEEGQIKYIKEKSNGEFKKSIKDKN